MGRKGFIGKGRGQAGQSSDGQPGQPQQTPQGEGQRGPQNQGRGQQQPSQQGAAGNRGPQNQGRGQQQRWQQEGDPPYGGRQDRGNRQQQRPGGGQQQAWGGQRPQAASQPQQQQAWGGQRPQAASQPQQQQAWSGQRPQAASQPQQQQARGGQRPQAASQPQQQPAWGGQKPQAASQPQQQPAWGGQRPQTASQPQQQPAWGGQKPQAAGQQGAGGQKSQSTPKSPTPSVASLTQGMSSATMSPPRDSGDGCYAHKGAIKSAVAENLIKQIPVRKDITRAKAKGRPIDVLVNMLALEFNKNSAPIVIHYDVDIDEKTPKNAYREVMKKICAENFRNTHPAFDGRKNLYAARNLFDQNELQIEVQFKNMEERDRTARVTIKKVNVIDISWMKQVRPGFWRNDPADMTSIQAIDVILKAAALRNGVVPVGRSIFPKHQPNKIDIGEGAELWIGTFTSAVMGWKPYLNVDVAHTGFPKAQNVADYMYMMYSEKEQSRRYDIKNMSWEEYDKTLMKFLRGLRVRYEIPGKQESRRVYTLEGFGKVPNKHMFRLEIDGKERETSVEAYYAMKGYKIKSTDIPCIQVRPAQKNIFVPPELCVIEAGQAKNFKLSENQTRDVVKFAATSTDIRKKKIYDGVDAINYNADATLKEFGISVGTQFEQVKARILDAPTLQYNNRTVNVNKGVWNAESFLNSGSIPDNQWTLMSIDRMVNDKDLMDLKNRLTSCGGRFGISFGRPLTPFKVLQRASDKDLENSFADLKKAGIKLTIVVISEQASCYEKVKQMSELKVGMLTQCVKANTVKRKLNDSTVGNILLKINAKLNGTNHALFQGSRPKCLKPHTMIIGADVTHPDPGMKEEKPSIAAVAANHDQDYFKYNITIRLQPCRTEIIVDLKNIVRNELEIYKQKTGNYPEIIIFFRDGVSEGQFPQVMEHEIKAVKEACKLVNPSYNPPLTFMVVQKRHHTRFFPKTPNPADRRNNNVSAGTIVDTTITHPTHIDFYLVSHASIQGTARPTKYRCLCNESNISEDDIEELTYHLCHLFSRCTRSVSYPAPTYYAHLGAFRARAWTHNKNIDMSKLHLAQKEFVTERVSGDNPMFFV